MAVRLDIDSNTELTALLAFDNYSSIFSGPISGHKAAVSQAAELLGDRVPIHVIASTAPHLPAYTLVAYIRRYGTRSGRDEDFSDLAVAWCSELSCSKLEDCVRTILQSIDWETLAKSAKW